MNGLLSVNKMYGKMATKSIFKPFEELPPLEQAWQMGFSEAIEYLKH